MDLFLTALQAAVSDCRVRRVHLHEFLNEVHLDLHMAKNSLADMQTSRTQLRSGQAIHHQQFGFFDMSSKPWWLLGEKDDTGRRRTGFAASCVHASRHGGKPTSIEQAAHKLASKVEVLCLDEVDISTLQDCVVLGPLLRTLCELGVVIVATSNCEPSKLYAGGLNRHIHLPPLTAAIHSHCVVHNMNSNCDYRVHMLESEQRNHEDDDAVFCWGCTEGCRRGSVFLDSWWQRLSGTIAADADVKNVSISYGRSLRVMQSRCQDFVRFHFDELCATPLNAEDFAALCRRFRAILISDVPLINARAHPEAQRWIWLLDQCYEHHTQLVMTTPAHGPAELVDLQTIAQGGAGGGCSLQEVYFAVARAASRLNEMQTKTFQQACAQRHK